MWLSGGSWMLFTSTLVRCWSLGNGENFDPSPLGHLFSSCWFSFVTGLASPFRNVMLPFVLEVHSEGNVEIPMKYPLPQHSWQSLPGNMTFSVDHSPIDRRKESESHDASAASTYLTLKNIILVGGIPTPLKNMKVSWGYYSHTIMMEKWKSCSKPPTSMSNFASEASHPQLHPRERALQGSNIPAPVLPRSCQSPPRRKRAPARISWKIPTSDQLRRGQKKTWEFQDPKIIE